MFIGREPELKRLKEFRGRKTAGLIVCSGRRRIGKSTLIEHFAEGSRFLEFYGLAPRKEMTNQDQLDHFGEQIGIAFKIPPMKFDSWTAALTTLAAFSEQGPVIVFLDEISWMGSRDKDFSGKLKGVWDTRFKKNKDLILILCGSVSSWIEENILSDKGFMGRISLTLHLDEMPLHDANQFWATAPHVSAYEKFKILGITGGVPRYLEEIQPGKTAEQNIKELCFMSGGILFGEFEKIFRDIFESRASDYKKIVEALVDGALELGPLCEKLAIQPTGGFSKKLTILMQSGFIQRDYVWSGNKKKPKQSKFRLRDNYLRFYLKYIAPKKELIEQGLYENIGLEQLPEWSSIMGLQFENLVFNNLLQVQKLLDIAPSNVLSAAPYYQNRTQRRKGCQIDLLIQTHHCMYVCEIKFRKKIGSAVIDEMAEKIDRLKVPTTTSVRPILIYEGDLSSAVAASGYFTSLIRFDQLLQSGG